MGFVCFLRSLWLVEAELRICLRRTWDDVVVAADDDGNGDGDNPVNMMLLSKKVVVMMMVMIAVTMRRRTGEGGERRGRTQDCDDDAGSGELTGLITALAPRAYRGSHVPDACLRREMALCQWTAETLSPKPSTLNPKNPKP